MDNNKNILSDGGGRKKRPELLSLLCILTFIGSGLATFSYFVVYVSYDDFTLIFEEMDMDIPEVELILSAGKNFFLTGFILYGISLFGAIRMWRLKKSGFHFYTVAQVFILLLPNAMISSYQFSILGLLVTVAFVIAYAGQLKYMH